MSGESAGSNPQSNPTVSYSSFLKVGSGGGYMPLNESGERSGTTFLLNNSGSSGDNSSVSGSSGSGYTSFLASINGSNDSSMGSGGSGNTLLLNDSSSSGGTSQFTGSMGESGYSSGLNQTGSSGDTSLLIGSSSRGTGSSSQLNDTSGSGYVPLVDKSGSSGNTSSLNESGGGSSYAPLPSSGTGSLSDISTIYGPNTSMASSQSGELLRRTVSALDSSFISDMEKQAAVDRFVRDFDNGLQHGGSAVVDNEWWDADSLSDIHVGIDPKPDPKPIQKADLLKKLQQDLSKKGDPRADRQSKAIQIGSSLFSSVKNAGPKMWKAYWDYENNPVIKRAAEGAKQKKVTAAMTASIEEGKIYIPVFRSCESNSIKASLTITASTPRIDYYGLQADWDEIVRGVEEMFTTVKALNT